jgi:hypothetical protein
MVTIGTTKGNLAAAIFVRSIYPLNPSSHNSHAVAEKGHFSRIWINNKIHLHKNIWTAV